MRVLERIEKPDAHADLIEIFEMEQEEGKGMIFPVAIDGNLFRFSKNLVGFWEPVNPKALLLADVRWYISGMINKLVEKKHQQLNQFFIAFKIT